MRHKIIIEQQATTQDSYGQITGAWTTFATVWADIKPLVGREYLAAQQVNSELTHDITLRYYPGVTAKMRISYGGRYFNIHSVIDKDERHQWLYLKCKEVLS